VWHLLAPFFREYLRLSTYFFITEPCGRKQIPVVSTADREFLKVHSQCSEKLKFLVAGTSSEGVEFEK
jgi:hypothetical protein